MRFENHEWTQCDGAATKVRRSERIEDEDENEEENLRGLRKRHGVVVLISVH